MSAPLCRCGERTELRKKRGLVGDVPVYFCSCCGRIRAVPARDLIHLPGEQLRELRRVVRKPKRRPTARKRLYQQALKSPHTRKVRERVFERAKGICERPGCTNTATDLAHLTYERLGAELDTDCEAQCRACNQQERVDRITRSVLGIRRASNMEG